MPTPKLINFRVVGHIPGDLPKESRFVAAYTVESDDGDHGPVIHAQYGDDLHDQGSAKALAFARGFCAAMGWNPLDISVTFAYDWDEQDGAIRAVENA